MMDQCIVCLDSNADIFSRINIQSSEWKECHIQRIIEKHLWWWYLRKPKKGSTIQWICRQCWQEISSFHNYYITVENANKNFQPMMLDFGIKEMDDQENATVKLESSGDNHNGPFLAEDLVPLKRRHKAKQPQQQQLAVEELDIVEVKSEDNLNTTDNAEEQESKEQCMDNIKSNTNNEVIPQTIDTFDVDCTAFINSDYHDFDEDYHVSANDDDTDDEDKINVADIVDSKRKRKRKAKTKKVKVRKETKKSSVDKVKKETKKSSAVKPKKVKIEKKIAANPNLNKVIKEYDDFLTESHHKLECNICSTHLADFRVLKIHYRNEHNTLGYAICCNKKFYKRGLLVDHLHVHKDPEYFNCQPCKKAFATRRGLEIHIESHNMKERKFKCEECGKSFFKQDIFERHKLMHVPEHEKNFPCNQCEKKFASDYLRRQHEDITHNKKYFKICDVCGKSFRDNYSFLRHMDEHTGAPPSFETCEICGKKLTNKYGLRQHMKMRHTEENMQSQVCPFCSRVSPNINAHRLHIKYTHTMERKHACHLCDKSFRRPLELKEHLSTHTGEALYTCPHCPRTFISNANMHKHRKIAHRLEWEAGRLKKFNESRRKIEPKNNMLVSLSNNVTTMQSCPENLMLASSGSVTNEVNF